MARPSHTRSLLTGLLAGLLTFALGACGGGSGSDGTPAVAAKSELDSSASTDSGPTAVSPAKAVTDTATVKTAVRYEGPITGFGSVILNNVRFNDNGASVQDEESGALARSDLRLGSYVSIDGQTDSAGGAQALKISVIPAVRGRIESIDDAGNSLTVLHQLIRTDATTVFEGSSITEPLKVGDYVEVHGISGNGAITATLVERKTSAYRASVRGVISNMNHEYKHFCIGPLVIYYTDNNVVPASQALADGMFVSVRSSQEPQGDTLQADLVRIRMTPAEHQGNAELVELKGIVETLADTDGTFLVSGIRVKATSLESLPKGGFAIGQRVQMRGVYSGPLFMAERIVTEMPGLTPSSGINQLLGTVADRVGKSFSVNGIAVDASQAAVEGGDLNALAAGAYVEVRGETANAATGTVVRASEVRIRQRPNGLDALAEGQRQILYGAIYEFDSAGRFKLNGQLIDASTAQFRRGDASRLANDVYVELHGAQVNGILVASEVEFKSRRAGMLKSQAAL